MKIKLEKIVAPRSKRLGQGYGSGKGGHTSGRGQKGQKSRGKIGILFEGVKVKKSFFKRLPLLRGKGKFAPKNSVQTIGLSSLSVFTEKETVDLETLIAKGIVPKGTRKVKVINDGSEPNKKFKLAVPASESVIDGFIQK